MPDLPSVPDLIDPLIGWRCWGLAKTDRGIQLVSRGNVLWPTDAPLTAVCDRGKAHQPPAQGCSCGIYALTTEAFPYYGYDGKQYAVFGQVALWGEVVRGTQGFRAQYAYPMSLYLAHRDWRYAQPLRDSYRTQVELRNPYRSVAA